MDHVAEIKSKIKIDQLATEHLGLTLHRRGKRIFVCSIYKEDKNPSMLLDVENDKFHDFSSGNGGDTIDLYKDYYHLDFKQALQDLCRILGIEYKAGQSSTPSEKPLPGKASEKPLVKAFTSALMDSLTAVEKAFFEVQIMKLMGHGLTDVVEHSDRLLNDARAIESVIKKTLQLKRLEANKEVFTELFYYCRMKGQDQSALLYLIEVRKIPAEMIKKFKLFTIANYNEVNNHMKKTFPMEQLQKSGLFNRKPDGSGNLVFFQHRIIIPYLHNGEIVYLRGRYYDNNNNSKTNNNKYIGLGNDGLSLNGTKRFFNTDVLKNMLRGEKLYVVEGEFDAIILESMGFNALCIPGAGNMPEEVKFRRLAPFDVILCVDNDPAGNELQTKLIGIFKRMNKSIKIKKLDTKDINDFVVKHEQE